MKSYVVYDPHGNEIDIIKAGSHNAAEKKARKKFEKKYEESDKITVAYTEV